MSPTRSVTRAIILLELSHDGVPCTRTATLAVILFELSPLWYLFRQICINSVTLL